MKKEFPVEPYEAGMDTNGNHRVNGPGDGFGWHSATLWPHLACASQEECKRAAEMCNIAYNEGVKATQAEMRKALGIK